MDMQKEQLICLLILQVAISLGQQVLLQMSQLHSSDLPWEYSLKIVTMQWTDDWPKFFDEILERWPCEAAALRMIY